MAKLRLSNLLCATLLIAAPAFAARSAASAARTRQMPRSQSKSRTPKLCPDAHDRIGLKTLRAACEEHGHCHHQNDAGGWGRIYPAPFAVDRGSSKRSPLCAPSIRVEDRTVAIENSGSQKCLRISKSDTTILSVDKRSKQTNSDSTARASLAKHGRIKC